MARSGRSKNIICIKNDSQKGCRYHAMKFYYTLRLANPIKPIRPEPNNHTAVGTGTEETTGEILPLLKG